MGPDPSSLAHSEPIYLAFAIANLKKFHSIYALAPVGLAMTVSLNSRASTEALVKAYIEMLDRIDSDARSFDKNMPMALHSFSVVYDYYRDDKQIAESLSSAFERFIERRLALPECSSFSNSKEKRSEYLFYSKSMSQIGLPKWRDLADRHAPNTTYAPKRARSKKQSGSFDRDYGV